MNCKECLENAYRIKQGYKPIEHEHEINNLIPNTKKYLGIIKFMVVNKINA